MTDTNTITLIVSFVRKFTTPVRAFAISPLELRGSIRAKDNLRKAYEKCNDISQESRALIDTFLKKDSDKDYELDLSMYGKAAKLEKQIDAKLAWLLEKYYRSQEREYSLNIDDSDLHLTHVLLSSSSARVEPSPSTPNPVRQANLLKERDILLGWDGAVMSTQEYMQKVVEGVDEDDNVKIHYKVIGEGGYENDITVEAAMILANVLIFSPKPSMHYVNITRKNVVKVFCKDTVPTSFNFPTTHKDQSSSSTHSQQSFPINNKYNPQPSLNQNFMQPPMTSLEDINDPTEAMNATLILFARAFQLTAPTNNNQKTSSNPRNRQIAQPVMNMGQDRQIQNVGGNGGNQFGQYVGQVAQNQQGYNAWQNGGIQGVQNVVQNAGVESGGNQNGLVVVPGIANQNGTGNVVAARAEGTGNGYQPDSAAHCSKERSRDLTSSRRIWLYGCCSDLDKIKEVNANCILMVNLQHVSTSGTQLDKAPVYDTDGSAEVHLNDNCYDNEIFNMFTREEQYTDLPEPILEPQLVPQNDNHVTYVASSMVQSGGTVETSSSPKEETRAHQETVYRNLVDQVAQVNMVNCNMRATNAELKSELARYKIQEQRIKISQEKYEMLEKCYQKSVYQEQCLTRKINALHLSSTKQITTLNDEISNLNKQLSKEKSYISSLMEEKKRLKHDFKTQEDKFLDKEADLEAKIKDLDNNLIKRDQTV
nr:hypothetical protein [Tanacetum cinerariifolium]